MRLTATDTGGELRRRRLDAPSATSAVRRLCVILAYGCYCASSSSAFVFAAHGGCAFSPSGNGGRRRRSACAKNFLQTPRSSEYFRERLVLPPLEPIVYDEDAAQQQRQQQQPLSSRRWTTTTLDVVYTNHPGAVEKWLVEHIPGRKCVLGFDVEVSTARDGALFVRSFVLCVFVGCRPRCFGYSRFCVIFMPRALTRIQKINQTRKRYLIVVHVWCRETFLLCMAYLSSHFLAKMETGCVL